MVWFSVDARTMRSHYPMSIYCDDLCSLDAHLESMRRQNVIHSYAYSIQQLCSMRTAVVRAPFEIRVSAFAVKANRWCQWVRKMANHFRLDVSLSLLLSSYVVACAHHRRQFCPFRVMRPHCLWTSIWIDESKMYYGIVEKARQRCRAGGGGGGGKSLKQEIWKGENAHMMLMMMKKERINIE